MQRDFGSSIVCIFQALTFGIDNKIAIKGLAGIMLPEVNVENFIWHNPPWKAGCLEATCPTQKVMDSCKNKAFKWKQIL